jgi:uncharacterized protein
MEQTWNDLLFAHWPLPPEILRPLVPSVLPLDTFEGQCWVAVTPFHMTGVRLRWLPALPGPSRFPEMNVRTYVTFGGKPGVFFFSLDVANLPAVWAARGLYHLPYFHARMSVGHRDGWITYESLRATEAMFRAKYQPVSEIRQSQKGTLEHWLTERYCLYTVTRNSAFRAEIHHVLWPLQDAEAEIFENTTARAAGIKLPEIPPLLHFARQLQVLIWPLVKA